MTAPSRKPKQSTARTRQRTEKTAVAVIIRKPRKPKQNGCFPPLPPTRLSPREWEVLNLLAEGLTTQKIGARLGISLPTAKFHLTGLYRKLGIKGAVAAIRVAFQRGLFRIGE